MNKKYLALAISALLHGFVFAAYWPVKEPTMVRIGEHKEPKNTTRSVVLISSKAMIKNVSATSSEVVKEKVLSDDRRAFIQEVLKPSVINTVGQTSKRKHVIKEIAEHKVDDKNKVNGLKSLEQQKNLGEQSNVEEQKYVDEQTNAGEQTNNVDEQRVARNDQYVAPLEKQNEETTAPSVDQDLSSLDALSVDASNAVRMSASDLEERYLEELRVLISQMKRYPKRAIRQRQEGIVWVKFSLDPSGVFEDIRLLESSGYSTLDKAALATISQIEKFKPVPTELAANTLNLSLPLQYVIR